MSKLTVKYSLGTVTAISDQKLEGTKTLNAKGQIVAPGFIDLHAHGQQLPAAWGQAFDGVTTALELESGLLPVSKFYENVAKEGRPTKLCSLNIRSSTPTLQDYS